MKKQGLKIKVKDLQKKISVDKKKIVRLAKQILQIKGLRNTELSVAFVSRNKIRGLNKRFLHQDRSTDVLAFGMPQTKTPCPCPKLLGDVVICPETAAINSRIYRTATAEEIILYLIHGILHLLGYDDRRPSSAGAMQREQRRILQLLVKKQ